jgi:hypothetical protein
MYYMHINMHNVRGSWLAELHKLSLVPRPSSIVGEEEGLVGNFSSSAPHVNLASSPYPAPHASLASSPLWEKKAWEQG